MRLGANDYGLSQTDMLGFNSSLVRLGAVFIDYNPSRSFVSIPAWCDWELGWTEVTKDGSKSFNSSLVRLGEKFEYSSRAIFIVSIPAWCDWEKFDVI